MKENEKIYGHISESLLMLLVNLSNFEKSANGVIYDPKGETLFWCIEVVLALLKYLILINFSYNIQRKITYFTPPP